MRRRLDAIKSLQRQNGIGKLIRAAVEHGAREGEVRATIKRVRRKTGNTWYLRQWTPPEGMKADSTLSRQEWPICHRVVGKYSRG